MGKKIFIFMSSNRPMGFSFYIVLISKVQDLFNFSVWSKGEPLRGDLVIYSKTISLFDQKIV